MPRIRLSISASVMIDNYNKKQRDNDLFSRFHETMSFHTLSEDKRFHEVFVRNYKQLKEIYQNEA